MADLHNEIKFGTGPMRALTLGIGVDGDGVVRLDESLTPIVDWWAHPDFAILAGDFLQSSTIFIAAPGAGLRAIAALVNPAGSGRLLIVEEIRSLTVLLAIRRLVPAPVVGVGGWLVAFDTVPRDYRITTFPQRMQSNITGAAQGTTSYQLAIAGATNIPFVLGPNSALLIDPNADNAAVEGVIAWRERILLPGEPPSNR